MIRLSILLALAILAGCKKSSEENTGAVPQNVRNVTVQTISDGVEVFYEQPNDGVAVSVVAEYPDDDGVIRSFTFDLSEYPSSFLLNDKISIRRGRREVEIYTVNAQGGRSEGLVFNVEPLPPASILYLNAVLESTKVGPTPTGFYFCFENPNGNDLVFSLFLKEGNGDWTLHEMFASGQRYDVFAIDRLFPSEVRLQVAEEGVADYTSTGDYLVEAFNKTEVLLEKANWSVEELPGDVRHHGEFELKYIWDGIIGGTRYESDNTAVFPQTFTIDLGVNQSLNLSKMRVHCAGTGSGSVYDYFHPKEYDVWGSNDPAADGSWAGWTKIRSCHSIKLSNEPEPGGTMDDYNYAAVAGEDYGFPENTESYRYFRFRTISRWFPFWGSHIRLHELTLWGVQ